MRPLPIICLLGLSLVCSSCALVEDASRNILVGIRTPVQEHREECRNRKWAEAAWCKHNRSPAGTRYTDDYAEGFKDGYAEHLLRGGNGEPPLVAPLRYRHIRYQNPQGYQAIQDWFAGYRHGAGAAQESGARKWITGPSALPTETNVDVGHESPPVQLGRPLDRTDEPIPLELPPPLPKFPEVKPVPEPAPEPAKYLPEPMKVKITGVKELPQTLPEPPQERPRGPEPLRARIMRVSEAPSAPVEAPRAKIKTIKAAPLDE